MRSDFSLNTVLGDAQKVEARSDFSLNNTNSDLRACCTLNFSAAGCGECIHLLAGATTMVKRYNMPTSCQ